MSCLQNFYNLVFQGIVRIYILVFVIQDLKKVVENVFPEYKHNAIHYS
jgi:hypothetical protein